MQSQHVTASAVVFGECAHCSFVRETHMGPLNRDLGFPGSTGIANGKIISRFSGLICG